MFVSKKRLLLYAFVLLFFVLLMGCFSYPGVFAIILSVLSLLCFAALLLISSFKVRIILVNATLFFSVLCTFEFYYLYREKVVEEYQSTVVVENIFEKNRYDDILGVKPSPGTVNVIKRIHDELIYNVMTGIDRNGHRVTPACQGRCDTAIVFFGDSFTFGEGVNDEETLPWQVGEKTGFNFRIYNFAYSGYGPQQMLSAVESGLLDSICKAYPKYFVYQAIYPEHVYRLAGLRPWVLHGPRYRMNTGAEPVFDGHFDDGKYPPEKKPFWLYSALGRRIAAAFDKITEKDKQLFVAVVLKTKEILSQKYPTCAFHLIVWDWTMGNDEQYFNILREKGVVIHPVVDLLPDGDMLNMDYRISEHDKHPNPFLYSLFADYIVSEVIKMDQPRPKSQRSLAD